MLYMVQPFVPNCGPIAGLTAQSQGEAGDLARDFLRENTDAVCVVMSVTGATNGKSMETLSVYAGVNVPIAR